MPMCSSTGINNSWPLATLFEKILPFSLRDRDIYQPPSAITSPTVETPEIGVTTVAIPAKSIGEDTVVPADQNQEL